MRYSLLAGGKRIRPILTLEFCRVCGGDMEKALPFAAAIEMVHTYSLIHDDLPCMDNDDYRRGRLTNHKVFGEANAVLAGDALLTAAFGSLAKAELPADRICKAVALLSKRAGECGMVGGQVLDLAGEQLVLTEEEIYNVHRLKTGALISAACQLGVIAAGGTQEQLDAADRYAEALGLAFQTRDDMLDVLGDSGKMGKATGMDENKNTFVRLYGVGARSTAHRKGNAESHRGARRVRGLRLFKGAFHEARDPRVLEPFAVRRGGRLCPPAENSNFTVIFGEFDASKGRTEASAPTKFGLH